MVCDNNIKQQDYDLITLNLHEIDNLAKVIEAIDQKISMMEYGCTDIKIVFDAANYVYEVCSYLDNIGYSVYHMEGTSIWLSKSKGNSLSRVDLITQIIELNCKTKELETNLCKELFKIAHLKSMSHRIENEFYNIQAEYVDSIMMLKKNTLPPIWYKMANSKMGIYLRKVFSLYCKVKKFIMK